jgi:hypothetical protein
MYSTEKVYNVKRKRLADACVQVSMYPIILVHTPFRPPHTQGRYGGGG